MTLKVILWTASILKVVNPGPDDPLYVFRDPACSLRAGRIELRVDDPLPEDPAGKVSELWQGETTCDVFEVVYPGP